MSATDHSLCCSAPHRMTAKCVAACVKALLEPKQVECKPAKDGRCPKPVVMDMVHKVSAGVAGAEAIKAESYLC